MEGVWMWWAEGNTAAVREPVTSSEAKCRQTNLTIKRFNSEKGYKEIKVR